MNLPLYSTMAQKIKDDLDLNEETFIQPNEFIGYFNEAVSMIESLVHTLYEDYLLSFTTINVTAGQSVVQLPSNIYANKIRKMLWYFSQNERYEIVPLKKLQDTMYVFSKDRYRYILINNGISVSNPQGAVAQVYPAFQANSSYDASSGIGGIQLFYLRSAARYVDATSQCDIPEFSYVIDQYVRYKCSRKEGHPAAPEDLQDFNLLAKNMIETLRGKVVDENTEIEKDVSFYSDFDSMFAFW